MNKIIIGFLALCFSLQAQATEFFKKGTVWMDKSYEMHIYYSPIKAELLKSTTSYSPFIDGTNSGDLDSPEQCRLYMRFNLGTAKIIILDGVDVVSNSTHPIFGLVDINQPVIEHQCSEKLPASTDIKLTSIDTLKLTAVGDGNQEIKLDLTLWDNNTSVTFGKNSEVVSSTPFASTYGKTEAEYDDYQIPGEVNLMSPEEWALHQQELIRLQNEPNVEPRQ